MRRINSDIAIALLLLAFCAVLFYETFQFRQSARAIVSSSLWPRLIIVSLAALSLAYLIQSILRAVGGEEEVTERSFVAVGQWFRRNQNVLWCFGLFAIYVSTLPFLGMLIGSFLFVFSALTVMGPNNLRSHVTNIAIAFVAVLGVWAVFTYLLGVMLPQGRILRIY